MIVIEDLLFASDLRRHDGSPEMDPLTEADALQEAQLLDLRFDALRSSVGLIFELRTALQLREANTGLLVAHGVREIAWSANIRSTDRAAWNVMRSTPHCEDRLFTLNIVMSPQARLTLVAQSAGFYVLDVPGLDDAPPDYGADDETVRSRLAGWHSTFTPVQAVFLDPAPSDD
jgi:hypothetical protein